MRPFGAGHPKLAAYFERLLARPSFARTLDEARPYFAMFPLRERIPARFLQADRRMNRAAIALDRTFHALGDPSRLGMIERLSRGPASVKQLAEPLDMALPSVMKHLQVLEEGRPGRSRRRPAACVPTG